VEQGWPGAAQDAGARLLQRRLHGDADDRLSQPGESGEALARAIADIGEVSMRSGKSAPMSPTDTETGRPRRPQLS